MSDPKRNLNSDLDFISPALQESRQSHTSAASGVAYAEGHGATSPLNWTEVGPKAWDEPL
jgi:hypothetical protein